MITRFFRTSKPQHYFIFLAVLIGVYVFKRIRLYQSTPFSINYTDEGLSALAVIGAYFLVIFIITKNNLTQKNSFAAVYFCLFSALIPEVFSNVYILVANLFVLMALRRIFSINTGVHLKKKYYDSTLWLCVATLFYPLAILYLVPVLVSVVLLQTDGIKHLLVIGFGVMTVAVLGMTSSYIFGTDLPWNKNVDALVGFDFSAYNDPLLFGGMAFFLTVSTWAILSMFKQQMFNSNTRFLFTILLMMHIIGVAIPLITAEKSAAECLFILFPLAVLSAKISEDNRSSWISELIMTITLLLATARTFLNISTFV